MQFPRISLSELLLRGALALAFLYPPIDAISDPYAWVGYFPSVVSDFVAPHQLVLLHTFGVLEVALAIWLLVSKRPRIPALIMTILLLAIVAANLSQFSVLFRDVALALVALSLAFRPSSHA